MLSLDDAPGAMHEKHSLFWVNHFAVGPGDGGGTRHFEIARELTGRNWRVIIGASDFHLQSRRFTRRSGADVHTVIAESIDGVRFQWYWSAPYLKNNWRRGWNWLSFAQMLLRFTSSQTPPDVVIGSSPHLFAALASWRLAARWRVPFVFEVRDLWPESMVAAGGRKGPAYHVFDRIAKHLYARADRIVCLAQGTMSHLKDRGVDPQKMVYIPNGVDVGAFEPRTGQQRDSFTLVYAGAHGPANDLETVLQAAEILENREAIRFLLVGDGPAKQDLIASARERGLTNVEFRSPVPKLEIPRLFANADAGLMVLRNTPLFAYGVSPNKLFDYFGASLPVVCNVPGEVAGMLAAAKGGEQAEPGSARSLADAIVRLYERSHEERAEMGRSAREWVTREHSREVLADRLDGMLRELIES